MKWTNKGNELATLIESITSYHGEYAIWGAGLYGEDSYIHLKKHLNISFFIDSDPEKTEFCGLTVFPPDRLQNFTGCIIVASSFYDEIKKSLKEMDFHENKDFFFWKKFTSLYFYHVLNQISLSRVDISLTNRCTLRCKYCNMFMPHFQNPDEQSFDAIKQDIDGLFSVVDYVNTIKLLGGEPFLYKNLCNVIDYIGQHYGRQLGYLELYTNGTIVPNQSLLALMKAEKIKVQVTDYTKAVDYSEKLREMLRKLDEFQIPYSFYSLDKWLDFGFPHNSSNVQEESHLINKFDACSPDFRGLVGNKLYFCHLSASAEKADMFQGSPSDYIVLDEKLDPIHLLEFDLGYNDLGYVSFCKLCRGCNSDILVDGNAQLERKRPT